MVVEHIRLSQKAKDQLIKLKRKHGYRALERAVSMGVLPVAIRSQRAACRKDSIRQQRGDELESVRGTPCRALRCPSQGTV